MAPQSYTPTESSKNGTSSPTPAPASNGNGAAKETPMQPQPSMGLKKRLVVCCDGTWQDALIVKDRWKYTNVYRLTQAIHLTDTRVSPPVPQIVYYQAGIGSNMTIIDEIIDGATGATIGQKIQEAYAFIVQNYESGDEIFLFGFSRGAYTARMVAKMIGAIGVLQRSDMGHFADIFLAFQKRGRATDAGEIKQLDEQLAPWLSPDSTGKKRCDSGPHSFSIKCVGVFDTVGALGLPVEIVGVSSKATTIYGFHDKVLGEHIEKAYQALALNETREDFECTKFDQSEGGKKKGQLLTQCWFTGAHSDIGGGYEQHDLSDLTLTWMAANVSDILAIDENYLLALGHDSVAPWGEQPPHNPLTGIYTFADRITRKFPTATNEVTCETIHPSVKQQKHLSADLLSDIEKNPSICCALLPLEEQLKKNWVYNPSDGSPNPADTVSKAAPAGAVDSGVTVRQTTVDVRETSNGHVSREIQDTTTHVGVTHAAAPGKTDGLQRLLEESNISSLLKELLPRL